MFTVFEKITSAQDIQLIGEMICILYNLLYQTLHKAEVVHESTVKGFKLSDRL